ncbi:MAG: CHASE2 domain-containing protein [Symploca sp. SIO2D2]|nr:CHASE2 domain-containing protein [Symploca sp. SIO2D2]
MLTVTLNFSRGDFTTGFDVNLSIRNSNAPICSDNFRLAGEPLIERLLVDWRNKYEQLVLQPRGDGTISLKKAVTRSRSSLAKECQAAYENLGEQVRSWFQSPSFEKIRLRLIQSLKSHGISDHQEIMVIIQASGDSLLRQIDWYQWDFFKNHPQAGLIFWGSSYDSVIRTNRATPRKKIRVLCILGQGVQNQTDWELLNNLPDVVAVPLKNPQLEELCQQLRDQQGWDILVYAGHSSSRKNKSGQMRGQIESDLDNILECNDFKYALTAAADKRLQLIIFNSCSGLGLANQLTEFNIPHIMVMRELVPESVAQGFLQVLLQEFPQPQTSSVQFLQALLDELPQPKTSLAKKLLQVLLDKLPQQKISLSTALRHTQQHLESFNQNFPGVNSLPVLFQNPTEEPLTWEKLRGEAIRPFLPWLRTVLVGSVGVTLLVMGVRSQERLLPWELKAYDHLIQSRLLESEDERLLIIGGDEEDLRRYGWPLPDDILARLLDKLEQHQPSVIGLDIVRDQPVPPGQEALVKHFQENESLVAVCAFNHSLEQTPAPPPQSPETQVGFVDLFYDPLPGKTQQGIVRHYLLSRKSNAIGQNSPCQTDYSFGWQLAYRYLTAKGILVEIFNKDWKFGSVVAKRLEKHSGGYQKIDEAGNQLLLNYRHTDDPAHIAQQVTIREILDNNFRPDWVKGRVVLIGITAPSIKDPHGTPYGNMRGLFIHAHAVSQIISAVEDDRHLLSWSPWWGDILWVWLWSLTGGVIFWRLQTSIHQAVALSISIFVLYGCCWIAFSQLAVWIPLVPSALALVFTAGGVVVLSNK